MKRLRRITFAILLCLIVVVILLLSGLTFIIATDSGTEFAWRQVQTFLPDTVKVHSLAGRLAGPLEISGLDVRTEAFHLELERAELQWTPSRLFRRLLDIELIAVQGLRYTQLQPAAPKPADETAPFELPQEIAIPFDVRVGKVSLRDFEFRSQPDTEPFIIDSATLAATARGREIDLSDLNLQAPLLAIEGTASLTTDRDYLLRGELRWQVPVPHYPTMNGRTLLDGSLRELTIKQTIAKPYDTQAVVLLKNPVNDLKFEATVDVNPLQLQALNKELPPVTAQLQAKGKGDPNDLALKLTAWVEDASQGRINAALNVGLKSQTVTIDQLKITVPQQPAQLTATGRLEFEGKQALSLKADWQQLQWPLQQPQVKSPKGHITLAGKIEDYSLIMQTSILVPEQTDAEIRLEGHGSHEVLDLSRIAIKALEGELAGTARISWKPDLQGAVDLSGEGLNPGVLLHEWPGKLGILLRAQGGIKGEQPNLQLQQLRAQGQLRGYELSLDAEGAYEEKVAMLKRLTLTSGSTRIEAKGTIGDRLDASWQIHSEDLATLLPNAMGRIDGKGTLAGPVNRPRVKADLTAEGLLYSDYRVETLNLDADVDLTGENRSWLSLALQEGYATGIELRQIVLQGEGDLDVHAFTLVADTSSGQADIALQGGLQNPWQQEMAWHFKLNQAKFKYPDLAGWALQAPSTGRITAAQSALSRSCWQSAEALLCLQGQQSAQAVEANFELTNLPIRYFAYYLPPDIDVQGRLSGKGTFSQSGDKQPAVNVDLNTTKVRLLSQDSSEQEQRKDTPTIVFQPGDIQLQMQEGGLQASLALPLSQTAGIGLQAAIPAGPGPLTERSLQGQITTEIRNLDFIADLIPDVQILDGSLQGNMALAGSLASPVLNGRLALVEGAAKLERPGLNLKDIGVELRGEGDGRIRLTAHAASGQGELNIDGTADLRGKASDADIVIKGENFRVINTLEARVDASPDLSIALRGNRVDAQGEVVIPKAQIKLKTLPESAVQVSGDQVIIESAEQEEAGETAGRELYARVRIILGDEVSFNGFGLDARFEGNILAIEKPGEPTTGSGELKIVDGKYRAYGQELVIEQGRALFAGGPINQPGLDVRAVRRPAQGIVVGVQMRGNLKQPDLTLFSKPSMTQGNQLSYLVLGRPLSGTSDSEGSALSRAALALGIKGGNSVARKIGGKLGLDQFGVETGEAGSGTSAQQASFVIGKYLTPKLYVSYGLGLFDPVSTVRLQYAISSHWKLMTESSGAASGGDLIYTIETGK